MKKSNTQAFKAKLVRRTVKSIMDSRVEHKRVTATGATADLATAGVVNTISTSIAQGDNIGDRTGDVIRPISLVLRAVFKASTATAGTSYVGRMIVFQDLMNNGATPAVTDVLNTATPLSGFNSLNVQQHRFKILLDREVTPSSTSAMQTVFVNARLKMKGSIHYLSGAGNAAGSGKNQVYALFITDVAAAGVITYAWSYEIEYIDA